MKKSFAQKYTDIMPNGAGALFFIQMFSTLSFSVLYSTLVLYITNWLHLSDYKATSITASFVAFNYTLHLLGGYAGGRLLSYRSLFAMGMVCTLLGCVLISIASTYYLYWGLATFLTGSGLNITCINCMLTQLFQPHDHRREAAFLWNYSGMNIGFFVGFTISGHYQLQQAYHQLFLLSSMGNLIALVLVAIKWHKLQDINTIITRLTPSQQRWANLRGVGLIVSLILSLRVLLENSLVSNNLIMAVGVLMTCVIVTYTLKQRHAIVRNKMWAYCILAFTSLVFWTLYQLAPMGMMLFIERNVDRHYFGMLVPPQWVQNINTMVIILGGPLLSVFFTALRARGIRITIPLQFSFALLMIGIAFAILPVGIHYANSQGLVAFNWIIASYILQSLGELFISPIGYAMVGKLAPQRLQSLMMGTWLMITGVAATLSAYFSRMALGATHSADPLVTNPTFSHTFNMLGWTAIATSGVLLVLIPAMAKLIVEKKTVTTMQQTSLAAS